MSKSKRIITVANQKGGVGKTTTAINLGTALAAVGEKVLILDLDPQGNASTGFGLSADQRKLTTFEMLIGEAKLADTIHESVIPNLWVCPSSMDLLGVELTISSEKDRLHRVASAIQSLDQQVSRETSAPDITYVIIDCPPSLNLLTLNALVASQSVIVPLQCEFFALEGLSQLMRTVDQIASTLNPGLSIQGVLLTMFDGRNNLSVQVAEDVRQHLGDKVFETVIPRNVRLSEAPSYGKPALIYDLQCAGSQAYLKLASELLKREKSRKAA